MAPVGQTSAHTAFALGELTAELRVDDGLLGDGLGKCYGDGRGVARKLVKGVGRFFGRTLFGAGPAARAQAPVHIGGTLADFDSKVANIAGNVFYLRVGVEGDVGVLGHVHHLGAQNTGRAVHGGEGLVQFGHFAADGGLALHQHHGHATFGAVQGGLDARHAAADDQHALGDVKLLGQQGFVVAQLFHGQAHQLGGLVGIGFLVAADPGNVLADVGHFEHVTVEARAFYRAAEGGLVHARRTGSHHHAVQLVFVDGGLNGGLARFGAGVHGVGGVDHIGVAAGDFGHLGAVHGAGNVAAAVADEDAYSHDRPPSAASARRSSSSLAIRPSALTRSFSRPRSVLGRSKARPSICV